MHPQTLLTAAFCSISVWVHAQDKTEVQSVAEPVAHFTIFTGSAFSSHSFQLPASGVVSVQKNTNSTINVKNHQLHGYWKTFYTTAQPIDEGNLVKGVPDGVWQSWYPNGQLRFVRTFSADMLQRIQQDIDLAHPKLSRFMITERYKREGRNVLQYMNASYSFGIKQFQLPSSIEALAEQNSDRPNNYHPPFNKALHHGLYMNYFENGAVKDSGYYKEGLREGLWVHRADVSSGTWKGIYKHGIRQKEWKYYNLTGKLLLIVFFNNTGEEEWRKTL